jgi:type IX secretion system PorP/SprF family membrane protein
LINCFTVISQVIFTGNLYYSNPYSLNPAYAGYKGLLSAQMYFRQTSASFDGAPVVIGLGVHSPIYKNVSLGARFYKESEGLFENLSVMIDYAYSLKLTNSQSLRFGLGTGFKSNQIDYSKIIAEDPSAIIEVASKNYEGLFFQTGAGITYNWKLFDLSFSVPQLFESKKIINPEYCTLLSYRFNLKREDITLKPSVLLRFNKGKPTLYDLNLAAYWKNLFFISLAYRNRPGMVFSAGFNFKDLSISYAYETGLQNYSNLFDQIHEISISYSFSKKKTVPKDSIPGHDFPLVSKNDSLKSDSIHKSNIAKIATIKKNVVSYNDSLKIKLNVDTLYTVAADTNKTEPNLDDYEVIQVGDGIYSVSYKKNATDSAKFNINHYYSIINDSIVANKLLNKISRENLNKKDTSQILEKGFYTIRIYVDDSNKTILRDAEISMDTWFEIDNQDKFIYYLGHFDNIEDAQNRVLKLKKYDNLKSEIVIRNR